MTTDNLDKKLGRVTPRKRDAVPPRLPLQLVFEEYEVSWNDVEMSELTVDREYIDLKVDGDKKVVVVRKYVEVSLCECE